MFWTFVIVVLMFLACGILLVAEVFLPSAGLLTIGALGCLGGGVYLSFQQGPLVGWISVGGASILIPVTLVIAYRIFPKTRFGKALTLTPPELTIGDAIPDGDVLETLLGQIGTVRTPLRPVGMCDFSGRKVECVAENGYVEAKQKVRVIRIEGAQVTVRVNQE